MFDSRSPVHKPGVLLQAIDPGTCPEEESVILILAFHPDGDYQDWYLVLVEDEKKAWMAGYVHNTYEVLS